MTLSRFERDTRVTRVDATTFEAEMDPGWWIVRGPNGGYLMAILLRAFTDVVDDPARAPRSMSVHFTLPPMEGPVRVETRLERIGRTLTTVSGRMWQGDRLCVVGLAAFAMPRDAPEFEDSIMPTVPSPDRCEPLGATLKHTVPIRDRYDQRAVPPGSLGGDARATTGGWIRPADPCLVDAPLVSAFCDGWPPAIWERTAEDGAAMLQGAPTVDLTVHFRRTLPLAGAQPDDFYLAVFRTRMAMEGFIEEDGEIWSADGLLLAHSRQLGILI